MINVIFFILNVLFLVCLSFWFASGTQSLKKIYWPALVVKLAAGAGIGLLYIFYYHYHTPDTFGFFEDGVRLASLAKTDVPGFLKFLWNNEASETFKSTLNFTQSRAVFLSKVVSFFCLVTNDNYWFIALYFSLLSFFCSWKMFSLLVRIFPDRKFEAAVSFLFLPSVVFWSAGLMKECVALAALFFLSAVCVKIWWKQKIFISEMLASVFFVWILWQLKYYYAAIFLPTMLTSLAVKRIVGEGKLARYDIVLWLIAIVIPFAVVSLLKENFHPDVFLSVVVKNYQQFQQLSADGDAVVFDDLKPTISSVLMHAPWALFSGLFRPFIWEAGNVLQLFASIENAFMFIVFIAAFKNVRQFFLSKHRLLLLAVLSYSFLLCIFLTLSTPNFGTLCRYKVGYLPFLFFIISINNPVMRWLITAMQRLFSFIVR